MDIGNLPLPVVGCFYAPKNVNKRIAASLPVIHCPEEVCDISRKSSPVNVIFDLPETDTGKQELARRVAAVHAETVQRYLQQLNCPTDRITALLDAAIAAAEDRMMAKTQEKRD